MCLINQRLDWTGNQIRIFCLFIECPFVLCPILLPKHLINSKRVELITGYSILSSLIGTLDRWESLSLEAKKDVCL